MFLTLNCSVLLLQQTAEFVMSLFTSNIHLTPILTSSLYIFIVDIIFYLFPYGDVRASGAISDIHYHQISLYKNKTGSLALPEHANGISPSLFKSYNL